MATVVVMLDVAGAVLLPVWLPLPQEVCEAILKYLSMARPVCAVLEVFVCDKAPHRPLGMTTVKGIAQRAIDRAGVVSPTKGAHVFRHSVATTLVRAGATLDEIGVLLRHASRDTTAIYAKVDLAALHLIAQVQIHHVPVGPRAAALLDLLVDRSGDDVAGGQVRDRGRVPHGACRRARSRRTARRTAAPS